MVPENIHTLPWMVIGNSEGSGLLTAKISKGKYKAKLEIPGGIKEGSNDRTLHGGGMDIFWSHTILQSRHIITCN